jgi:hypothetical protein
LEGIKEAMLLWMWISVATLNSSHVSKITKENILGGIAVLWIQQPASEHSFDASNCDFSRMVASMSMLHFSGQPL